MLEVGDEHWHICSHMKLYVALSIRWGLLERQSWDICMAITDGTEENRFGRIIKRDRTREAKKCDVSCSFTFPPEVYIRLEILNSSQIEENRLQKHIFLSLSCNINISCIR